MSVVITYMHLKFPDCNTYMVQYNAMQYNGVT